MSHISKVEVEIQSLDDLKKACQRLGLTFQEGQTSYKWYGRWVGDAPLPEGVKQEDLGKCAHAIHVPGADYEVGIVKTSNKYQLLWDSWSAGKLEKVLGKDAGLLKQAYAIERVKRESKLKGYRIQEKRIDNGIRLIMTL